MNTSAAGIAQLQTTQTVQMSVSRKAVYGEYDAKDTQNVLLTPEQLLIVGRHRDSISYSERYQDDMGFEYRHVTMPKEIAKLLRQDRLPTEFEWRQAGIQQSPGWIAYERHNPEPLILIFRREVEPATTSDKIPQILDEDSDLSNSSMD